MNYFLSLSFLTIAIFSFTVFGQVNSETKPEIKLEHGLYCNPTGDFGLKPHECQRATLDPKKQRIKLNEKGKFYVFWGYQRAWHTKSDTTFHTPDGNFTIKDAVGKDRQSKVSLAYLDPTRLSTPQYNIRVGYFISDRWAIELGTDHMKWVFDNSRDYEITGSYDRQVLINGEIVDFSTAQEARNASFVKFEHSDGYNYPHISAQYNFPIFVSHNQNWSLVGEFGGGLGIFLPKTKVTIYDDGSTTPREIDNRFKVSGFGTHANGRLRLQYKGFFLQGSARFVLGKINNAPFLGDEGHISHTPILSTQTIFGGGYKFYLGRKAKAQRKANKKKRKARKAKRNL